MIKKTDKHRILILGASGFIGNAIYRELASYYKTFGTYCKQQDLFEENNVFLKFCVEEDSILSILNKVKPTIIISSLKGDYKSSLNSHNEIVEYIHLNSKCKLLFLSSASVFDGNSNFAAYENDKTKSETAYGINKIAIEKLILEKIEKQAAILRIPIVLGYNSPRILQLRNAIKYKADFEVFPNLIVSLNTITKLVQQIHYILNKGLTGTFHLASSDMIHHDELFKEITEKISSKKPIFKNVYESNNDRYLAILPKQNILPQPHRITVAEVITESTFNEEISTLKTY